MQDVISGKEKIPIRIELIPNTERTSIVFLIQSEAPLPIQAIIQTLDGYTAMLKQKYPKSPIMPVQPRIISP